MKVVALNGRRRNSGSDSAAGLRIHSLAVASHTPANLAIGPLRHGVSGIGSLQQLRRFWGISEYRSHDFSLIDKECLGTAHPGSQVAGPIIGRVTRILVDRLTVIAQGIKFRWRCGRRR